MTEHSAYYDGNNLCCDCGWVSDNAQADLNAFGDHRAAVEREAWQARARELFGYDMKPGDESYREGWRDALTKLRMNMEMPAAGGSPTPPDPPADARHRIARYSHEAVECECGWKASGWGSSLSDSFDAFGAHCAAEWREIAAEFLAHLRSIDSPAFRHSPPSDYVGPDRLHALADTLAAAVPLPLETPEEPERTGP